MAIILPPKYTWWFSDTPDKRNSLRGDASVFWNYIDRWCEDNAPLTIFIEEETGPQA